MKKYEAITTYIKNEISSGNIEPGQKLPSVRFICEKFNCSKVTAVKAYDLLEQEHIAYSVPKSGHYLIEKNLFSASEPSKQVIDFDTSSPDSCILPYNDFQHCTTKAMELYKNSLFNNTNAQGLPALIEVLVKQLQNYQVFASRKNIFITSGSQQAISILTRMSFPNRKENVLVEQPTYYGVLNSLKLNNITTIGINRTSDGIDFNEFERLLKYENIKFFYTIPRFHNPTGFSYSNKDKKMILELCEKYNVYIVEDDYLGDLETDSKSDPLYALDVSSRVIYLKTFSKVLLPGLRLSVNVLPEKLSKNFEEFKRWNDLNTSVLSQGALEIYIKNGMFDNHVKGLRRVYCERMNLLKEVTQYIRNANIKWFVPESGFFASFQITENTNITNFINYMHTKNILLTDPSKFYIKNIASNKLIRLSISSVNAKNIKSRVSAIITAI